jgi:hypothetical protein
MRPEIPEIIPIPGTVPGMGIWQVDTFVFLPGFYLPGTTWRPGEGERKLFVERGFGLE